jgi:hypothetical protein
MITWLKLFMNHLLFISIVKSFQVLIEQKSIKLGQSEGEKSKIEFRKKIQMQEGKMI